MNIFLTPHDDDYLELEGNVETCVLHDEIINILFNVIDDGSPVQGKISFKATEEVQETIGTWIYPETQKEKSRISDNQKDSESYIIKSKVQGNLEYYDGKKVIFSGTWKDEDGMYDLDIDAEIT